MPSTAMSRSSASSRASAPDVGQRPDPPSVTAADQPRHGHELDHNQDPPRDGVVIAVGNQKGGVAKTTITVNLAAALAEQGRRCLVWDLDVNRGASQHVGIGDNLPLLGSFEVLVGSEPPEEVILKAGDLDGVELPQGLELIAARRNLEGIDQALLEREGRFADLPSALKRALERIRPRYDLIFLDTAPNLTSPTIAAYKAADYFLLTAMPEAFALQGLNTALGDIAAARQHGNPGLTLLGVVLSNAEPRPTRLGRELVEYLQTTFGGLPDHMKPFATAISRSTIVPTAQKLGRTILSLDPHHKVSKQFRAVADELERRLAALGALRPRMGEVGRDGAGVR